MGGSGLAYDSNFPLHPQCIQNFFFKKYIKKKKKKKKEENSRENDFTTLRVTKFFFPFQLYFSSISIYLSCGLKFSFLSY